MRGIDISSWQSGMSAGALNSAGFAILKLSEGMYFTDPAFDTFYAQADIPLGAYVFSRATTERAARDEAGRALELLRGRPLPLGVYMDVEDPGQLALDGQTLSAVCKAFCDTIRGAGYTPGVYGSELGAWWKLLPEALGGALAWVANWSAQPEIPCDLWQYSSDTRLPGYDGPLDGDEALSARMLALLGCGDAPPQQDGSASGSFTLPGIPLLRFGDCGEAVTALQGELIAFGYPCGGPITDGAERADGIFGPQTRSAVLAFQQSRSLETDGVVGARTRGALLGIGR